MVQVPASAQQVRARVVDDESRQPIAGVAISLISAADLEGVEFYTPVEAGYRYGLGASSSGALVVWTRGRGPHKSEARTVR